MITTIQQDITKSTVKYIAHQCNCVTSTSAGVAFAIFNAFPYANIYKDRVFSRNSDGFRIDDLKDKPGTIQIIGNGQNQRDVE